MHYLESGMAHWLVLLALCAIGALVAAFWLDPRACAQALASRKGRWLVLLTLCVIGALLAVFWLDFRTYVQGWIGALFKASSGAVLGWIISRFIDELDLSTIAPEHRPLAGLSRAWLIGAGMIGVAVGV